MMRDIGLITKQRARDAPLHPGHGDRRRRQDVEVQGQRGGRGHARRQVRRGHRAHVRALRRAARRRKWTGGSKAPRASTASSAASTASPRATAGAERRGRRLRSQGAPQAAPDVSARSPRTSRRAGTSTPASRPSWSWSTCSTPRKADISAAGPARGLGEARADARALRALPLAGDLGRDRPRRPRLPPALAGVRSRAGEGGRSRGRRAGQRQAARPHSACLSARRRRNSKRARWRDEKVQPFLDGKQVVKIITVPDKLVNIV